MDEIFWSNIRWIATVDIYFSIEISLDIANKNAMMKEGDIGLIQNLGKVLFNEYALPFEISSVLFLSAMVGAVVIGRKE